MKTFSCARANNIEHRKAGKGGEPNRPASFREKEVTLLLRPSTSIYFDKASRNFLPESFSFNKIQSGPEPPRPGFLDK